MKKFERGKENPMPSMHLSIFPPGGLLGGLWAPAVGNCKAFELNPDNTRDFGGVNPCMHIISSFAFSIFFHTFHLLF